MRRLLLIILSLLPGAAWALSSDSFTNTNGTTLSSHNSNWGASGVSYNQFQIQSNAAANTGSALSLYEGVTFSTDQYSQATVVSLADTNMAVVVRGVESTSNFYACGINPGQTAHTRYHVWKVINGTYTGLWSHGSTNLVVSDVVRCEISGNTITMKINGADVTGGGVASGGELTSGDPGLRGQNGTTAALWDDWSADDIGGAGAAAPRGLLLGVYP